MASFITPFRPIETGPPWGWNPGQTFVQAFNDAQALQLKQQEIENERQIMEILLPYKVKKAALDLEELKSDMKVNEAAIDLRRQEIQYKNRALEETLKSRNRPRAIFNPSTGEFESLDSADTGGDFDSGGYDTLPAVTSAEDIGEPMIYNEDGTLNAEPLPSDEETDVLPMEGGALRVPTNPLIDEEVSQNSNPLLRDEFFGNIAATQGPTLKATQSEGFENPLAAIDEDAAAVPIGAQYTGGTTDVAGGKFDAALEADANTTPSQEMGFDLERFSQSVNEPEEVSDDERIVREIQAEREKLEQSFYQKRREGYEVSPDDLKMGFDRIDRKARAQLIPFIPKLGEVGQASMKTLLDGNEPVESAYLNAKRAVAAASKTERPQGAPDNPTLKAAIDNLKNYKSTLADADVLTTRQAATLGALERQVELYTAVPQSSPIQDFVSAQSELSSIQEAIRSRRPYARLTPGGDTEVIPFDELEPIAQEYQMRIDALAPRLREDPSVFNPMAYQREEDALAAKEQMLKENPDAFVITPKGEVSYLRNWNQVQKDDEESQPPAETTFPLLERGSRMVGQIARAVAPAARGYTASVAGAMRNLPASRAVEEAKNIKRIVPVVRGAASGFKRGFKGQPSK